MGGSKHWCFTLNNPTDDEIALYEAIGTEGVYSSYFVYGKEVGENGTPHLQCYVALKKRCSLRQFKDIFGDRVHAEAKRGTPYQAATYCKKDGTFREFGVPPKGQGSRSDLSLALASIKAGASRRVLLEEHTVAYSRAHRMLNDALLTFGQSRDWMPVTFVYWGETGIGKTRRAFDETLDTPYMHSGGSWFDGYDGQEDVVFDDFGGSEFKLTYLLKLLDRYPMRVPVKGSFVQWVPKRIWITSNYSPHDWFPNAKDEHKKALLRRFEKIVRFRRLSSVVNHGDCDIDEEVIIA